MPQQQTAKKPVVYLDDVLTTVDRSLDAWRNLEQDAGIDASVSVMSVTDELERLRERICQLANQSPRS